MNSVNTAAGSQTLHTALPGEDAEFSKSDSVRSIYVYEAPVRVWHWVNALAIVVLCITGYFIGSPLPTMPGEASDHFVMGYIRFFHFAAGYVLAVGLLGRIYWAFVGNAHARELFTLGSVLRDRGYEAMFIYGGYGYFDNMNAFFDANDYRVVDRRAIPAARIEFENVWGVADEHLYDQVIDEIDREKAARPGVPVLWRN